MDKGSDRDAAQLAAVLDEARRRIAALEAPGGLASCRPIVEAMFDGLSVVDAGGVHVDVNPALCRMTGFSREELLGTGPPHPYWPPEELDAIQKAMSETLAARGGTYALVFCRKSGERFPVLVTPTALRDEAGAVVAAFAVVKDMTELRRAEEETAESARVFRLTFDQSPVGAVIVELDFRFRRANTAFCAMTGYSETELQQLRFPDITHPDDAETDKQGIRRLMAGEIDRYAREKRYVRKDGSTAWGDIVVRCVCDDAARPLFLLAIVVDVSERVAAEADAARLTLDVREERDRLAALVDSIPDEIWFSDAAGRFTLANPAAVAEFGAGAAAGTDVRDLAGSLEVLRADGSPRPVEEAPPLRALAGETVRDLEELVRTPATGELRHRLVSATPVPGPDGAVLGSVSVVRDITELRRAAAELEAERARAQSYLDIADMMLVALDRHGAVILANRAACEMMGWSESELAGEDWFDLAVPAEIREALREVYLSMVRGESDAHRRFDSPVITRSGEQRIVAWRVAPVRDEADHSTGFLWSGQDTTEQRAAEQALCDSEERYRLLVRHANDGVFVHEMSSAGPGRLIEVNDRECDLLGYTREELLGLSIADLDAPEQRPRLPAIVRQLEETGQAVFETDHLRKDGGRVPVEISARLFELHGRRVILSVVRDVTERRQAQQALRESEERFRSLFEESPVALWHLDASPLLARRRRAPGTEFEDLAGWLAEDPGRSDETAGLVTVAAVNHASLAVFAAASREELAGGFLRTFTAEAREALAQALVAHPAGGPARGARCGFRRFDGSTCVLDVALSVGGGLDPGHVLASFVDVTEQVGAEEEVRRLNRELEERVVSRTEQLDAATRELEALAYSMAHDVRAPLRTIDGFSAIVMEEGEGTLTPESLANLQRVRRAAQTLSRLLDDLTGLSAVSRRELVREHVDVSATAADVAAEVGRQYRKRRVDVHVEPGLAAHADPYLVRLILRELLDNAWKFTAPRRHAHVAVGAVAEGGRSAFFVRDDGVGFDMRYAAHLFGAFQRMHPPGEFPGDGVGLATVQRLVRRHGGHVWAESTVGEGATFFFTLPAADAT